MSESTAVTAEREPINPVSAAFRNLRAGALTELAQELHGAQKEPKTETGAPKPEEAAEAAATAEESAETVLSHDEAPSTVAKPGEETETDEERQEREAAERAETEEHEEPLGLDPKVQERIDKRIGKEVAKRKSLEGERDTLKQQLAEMEARLAEREAEPEKPAQVVRDPAQPLAHVQTAAQLAVERQKAEEALRQSEDLLMDLESNPESVEQALRAAKITVTGRDGQEDFSEAGMRRFLKSIQLQAGRTLRDAIPQREQFLKVTEQAQGEVLKLLPELKDRKSPRYAIYQRILTNYPALKNVPGWPLEAAIHVLGVEALQKQMAAVHAGNGKAQMANGKGPAAARKAPPKLPASVTAPVTQRAAVSDEPDQETVERALKGDRNARLKVLSQLGAGLFKT